MFSGTMLSVRFDMQTGPAQPGSRLNLLLTDGGWRDESWADRLPRLLSPLGVEARRAQSGSEAARLLDATHIHAAIVDLTLPMDDQGVARHAHEQATTASAMPEEGGARLLKLLARVESPPPIIVVREPRQSREDARDLFSALQHGVFAVVDRPVNMELMLEVLRRLLGRHYKGQWPGIG
jgi:DNA-binding response OmpR family regulator